MDWAPESSRNRIIGARFYSKYRKLKLIHVCMYSPTNDASMESNDDLYEQLEPEYRAEV